MQKMKKYIFCLFCALALAASLSIGCGDGAMQTYADDGTIEYLGDTYVLNTSGDWQYILVDGSAVIMKYTATTASVNVPSTLGGYPVTAIGRDSSYGGKGAFQNNDSMQTVTIQSSVTYIDAYAFYNCTGLQQVLISDGVTEIGEYAFAECSYMQQIQIKGSTLKTIGAHAFEKCVALDNVTIPESVTTIGNRAFVECSALSYIAIPDSVTSLGGGCFAGCTALQEAVIGNGVPSLDVNGYYYNSGVDNYATGTFESCSALTKVTIGSSVETIGVDAFAGTGLRELVIPDNVVTIEAGAFYDCNSLKTVDTGDGVKTMGDHVFFSCDTLTTVRIGKNVRTIGVRAFTENISLTEIEIPSNVISLGGASFAGCTSLTKAVIGNGVPSLGANGYYYNSGDDNYQTGMFESCTNLSEIVIGDGVTDIGTDAFAGTALVNVTIPDGVVTISNGAFMNCAALTSITIGEGVTSIGGHTFYGDSSLVNVHLGNGVVSIGARAFRDCSSLRYLLIPSSVTDLGGGLCLGCTSLQRVIIGNGVTTLSTNGYYYNSGVDNYSAGTFESCSALTDISLGSGITSIGIDTFAGTALTSLLIPAKVNTVGNGAFYSSSFTNIYFTGAAPTMTTPFYTTTPALYKMARKAGYEDTGYAFTEFTPITVKFDLNDDDVFAIKPNDQYMTPDGGYVIEPIDPASEGYRFLGWYADSACTREWDFLNDRVTADTTIYAKWAKSSEVAPEAPGQVTSGTVTSTTAAISWTAVDGADTYEVYVDDVCTETLSADATSCTLTGLTPDSTYEVTVKASNAAGTSEASLVKVVQTEEGADVLPGDVNDSGFVDAADALKVLRAVVKLDALTDTQFTAADVTQDGKVTADDALLILRYVVKLVDAL